MLRYNFLSDMLQQVLKEGNNVETKIELMQRASKRVCVEACGIQYECLKRKCDTCGAAVVKQSVESTKPSDVPDNSFVYFKDIECRGNKTNTVIMEPIFCNPNSYETVATTLDHIKECVGIGSER